MRFIGDRRTDKHLGFDELSARLGREIVDSRAIYLDAIHHRADRNRPNITASRNSPSRDQSSRDSGLRDNRKNRERATRG